jgi:hypothetical protein
MCIKWRLWAHPPSSKIKCGSLSEVRGNDIPYPAYKRESERDAHPWLLLWASYQGAGVTYLYIHMPVGYLHDIVYAPSTIVIRCRVGKLGAYRGRTGDLFNAIAYAKTACDAVSRCSRDDASASWLR